MAMDLIAGRAAPGGPPGGGGADLAALLGGGGAPPGPPEEEGPSPATSEAEAIDNIMDALDAYLEIDTVDERERLVIEKMKTMAQQLHADNEKMQDQVMGTNRGLRKALGG